MTARRRPPRLQHRRPSFRLRRIRHGAHLNNPITNLLKLTSIYQLCGPAYRSLIHYTRPCLHIQLGFRNHKPTSRPKPPTRPKYFPKPTNLNPLHSSRKPPTPRTKSVLPLLRITLPTANPTPPGHFGTPSDIKDCSPPPALIGTTPHKNPSP
ncbi:hypothetical protein Salat_0221700 [Sesamum alatum]|uniref:Uncharacterized protein n=1 Tax=Sesamum alatum TaxID=300844 RepID=A0AAE1Z029_9LAMI|nr:hypothetical protein Salat_0221700 [Sesamum alatum]